MLAVVAEYDSQTHRRSVVKSKLHMELTQSSDEVTPRQKVLRTQEIQRLMRELQCRRQISTLRDRYRQVQLTGEAIARCLLDHWGFISEPSRVGGDKPAAYVKKYLPLDKLKACLPLVLKPADLDISAHCVEPIKRGPVATTRWGIRKRV